MKEKLYLSREQTRRMSIDHPVGDPTGGPAYGEKRDPVTAVIAGVGGSIVSGVLGGQAQADAAQAGAQAQTAASQAGIEEQRRQFEAVQKLLAPYAQAGQSAIGQQQAILGLLGAPAQKQAYADVSNSPEMQAYLRQGQNALLQNASATGGLRGGNVQAALAQFSPQLLSQLMQQRLQNLGGLTSIGQNAAAGTGNAGMASAGAIGNLLQQQGAAQAGASMAAGQSQANMFGGIGQAVGNLGMLKALKVF